MRMRLAARRPLFVVALGSTLIAAALFGAVTAEARDEVLVGRYAGHVTGQGKNIEFRVARDGEKLEIASFSGSLEARCQDGGTQGATFSGGKGTAIPTDGKVKFTAGGVDVSIILGGPVAVGRIDYSMPGCHDSVRFTAELQPPDPILQAGRYTSVSRGVETSLTVLQKRGYFELTQFSGLAENCQDQKLGIDAPPEAFIDGEGHADFTALGGRVKVEVKFHHKSHVEGRVTYSDGKCSETVGFGARLNPAI